MNLREAKKEIQLNILSGITTLMRSDPGYGKTDAMMELARWWKGLAQNQGKRLGMAVQFMATQSPIGWTGLPWRGERTWKHPISGQEVSYTITAPAIPGWYMATCLETGEVLPASLFDLVLLVIEEWGQGSPEAKRAGAEVLRAGGTPPFYLPPGSPRIALSNVNARDGVTKEYDFVIGRVSIIDLTPSADVWVEDFADRPYVWEGKTWNVMPISKHWAVRHPDLLFEPKPEKQGPSCNPRTFTNADRYVQVAMAENNGEIPLNRSSFIESLAGKIGMPVTQQYVSDLQFLLELPPYTDVVADPTGTPVPNKADLQMLMAYEMAGRVQREHVPQVLTYIGRLPAGFAITFVTSLLRRDWTFNEEPAMKAWTSKNAQMVSIIASLSR